MSIEVFVTSVKESREGEEGKEEVRGRPVREGAREWLRETEVMRGLPEEGEERVWEVEVEVERVEVDEGEERLNEADVLRGFCEGGARARLKEAEVVREGVGEGGEGGEGELGVEPVK